MDELDEKLEEAICEYLFADTAYQMALLAFIRRSRPLEGIMLIRELSELLRHHRQVIERME